MIIDDIVSYLRTTYCPKAIILHGSRARRDAFDHSDYDLALITENPNQLKPEIYQGHALDMGGIPTEEMILKAGSTPIWPCIVLFDDADHLGARLVKKTHDAFMEGAPSLTQEQRESRRVFFRRSIDRIQGRGHDQMVRYYYLCDFYQRSLRYWCEFNQKWTLSAYRLLPIIAKEDPVYYQILQELWSEDYQAAVKKVYQHLFAEDL